MPHRSLLCLAGDGIGPEITASALRVLEAVRPALESPVELQHAAIGFQALEQSGTTIPDTVISAAKAADGVLLGPVSHNDYPPVAEGGRNPSGVLRSELELFANIRPARSWPGLPGPVAKPVNLTVVRENLEGFYADRNMHAGGGEFMPEPGVALAMRKITAKGSERIARAGFDLARAKGLSKVCAVHKANVMRLSDGLFLDQVRKVATHYPEIELEELLVDAAAAHLVRDPGRFEVLITTNMFGDILSDLASELAGGLGLAGSLNAGPFAAAAQAQHGSAPGIAGQDKANPVSLILSLAMLLRHWGDVRAAQAIEAATSKALSRPETRTLDVGGRLGTTDFTDFLTRSIAEDLP